MKVLVIGDSCRDIFIYGKCKRLSPAAPVPVFEPLFTRENLGMAGNVYQNLVSLGMPCTFISNAANVEKKRMVEEETNHMLLRIDTGEKDIQRVKDISMDLLKEHTAVVISDYNKGFLEEEDIEFICDNHDLVFIDTKKRLGEFCKKVSYIKINEPEYNKSIDFISQFGWVNDKLIVTLGSKGCKYREETYSVDKVEIKDLSGAGDTFLAGLVYKYLKTSKIEESIRFANECATKAVQKKGVVTL